MLCDPRRCSKLKLKENATVFKLATVPHLPRIIVITRDRLLVLDATSAVSAEVAADAASGGADGAAVAVAEGEGGDPAVAAVGDPAADAGEGSATKGSATEASATEGAADRAAADGSAGGGGGAAGGAEAAAQGALPAMPAMQAMPAMVKSNHHLTELLKMTLLKKDPNVLTLHYRMGADMDQTKRRTYKLVTKEAFVAVRA